MTLRIGTRKSPLAQAQTDRVLAKLTENAEKVLIESEGDRDATSPLHQLERPGAFTSLLTDAILDGRIDAAVHSLKDLPLAAPKEAPIVAILQRDDPADILLAREDAIDPARPLGLRAGARVGTSAPRRQTQILAADAELVPIDVRGNVGTRMRLLETRSIDALLMAAAARERIPLPVPVGVAIQRLDLIAFPTCPGQGAIAVQAREGSRAAQLLAKLDDGATRAAVDLERALLAKLGGGCGVPLGAHATRAPNGWQLTATLAPPDWRRRSLVTLRTANVTAATTIEALATALEQLEAPLQATSRQPTPAKTKTLTVTLSPDSLAPYEHALRPYGWGIASWALVATFPTGEPTPKDTEAAAWIALTSPRAASTAAAWLAQRPGPPPRVAALGPATARALRREGAPVHLVSRDGTGAGLADDIAAFPAARGPVLLAQGESALDDLAHGLHDRGFETLAWTVYSTSATPSPGPMPACDVLLLTSPSNAEAYAALDLQHHPRLLAFGPSTEAAMRRLGLPIHATAPARTPSSILQVLS